MYTGYPADVAKALGRLVTWIADRPEVCEFYVGRTVYRRVRVLTTSTNSFRLTPQTRSRRRRLWRASARVAKRQRVWSVAHEFARLKASHKSVRTPRLRSRIPATSRMARAVLKRVHASEEASAPGIGVHRVRDGNGVGTGRRLERSRDTRASVRAGARTRSRAAEARE
jgi:hypothetical protein